ncbi:cyclase/dehydrase [Entophlyctis helioformis]|nr:cyclase/dehydrase [Entophlyctis helioformis]
MYALVTDIPEYKTFVPWCISSRILSTAKTRLPGDRLQTTLTGELGVGFQMFKETYVSTVRCVDKDYAVEAVASNSAVFKTLVNRWTFEGSAPTGTGGTDGAAAHVENACIIDFYVGFEFRHALYAQASALFLEQVSQMMVSSFEQRALVVYGRPSRRSLKL